MTGRTFTWIKSGGEISDIRLTVFIGNTNLEKIATKAGVTLDKTNGLLYEGSPSSSNSKSYLPKYGIVFSSKSNGVFEVTNESVTSGSTMSSSIIKKIESQLASGVDFADVSIGVKVE